MPDGALAIELNHIGTKRISAFHQSQELSIRIATRACVSKKIHKESAGIAIRSCIRGQGQKKSAEGRDRHAFSIIEHRHGAAAAIDDRKGKEPAIGSAGRITLWCASFRSGRAVAGEIQFVVIDLVSAHCGRGGASHGGRILPGTLIVRDAPVGSAVPRAVDAGTAGNEEKIGPRQRWASFYAAAGRCARRKERICRTASGIRSFGSFHGNMLTSAFGASIAASIATA